MRDPQPPPHERSGAEPFTTRRECRILATTVNGSPSANPRR